MPEHTQHGAHHGKKQHVSPLAPENIGFVGLGNMGAPMARNLASWLHSNNLPALTLWNRTATKMPPVSESIKHAASLTELAQSCDIIFTSLASDDVAKSVYAQLFEGATKKSAEISDKSKAKPTIFVDSSTIYPALSGELERTASAIPFTYYLQCPVFGPPPMAEGAKLVWVISGDYHCKQRITPFLVPAMGRKFIDVGSNVERAAAFKLNGNFLILGIIEMLAESMTLADKTGVGSDLLMEFVKEFLPAPSFIGYGTKILKNSFEGNTGFTVEGGLKDANHIRHLAASVNATIPIIDVAHRHLITSRANGGDGLDWSSLVAGPRLAAGLQPFTGLVATPHDTGFGAKQDDGDAEEPQPVGGVKEVKNF